MSDDGILNADVAIYGRASAADSPPPAITSDPLVEGGTPVEQLLRALGLAANSGDPLDDTAGLDDYAERDAAMTDAAEGFAGQDGAAGTEMSQVPQMVAGIAGALAGALTGALQPVMQVPAQVAQGAGQALQAGTSLMSQYRGEDPTFGGDDDPDLASSDAPAGVGSTSDELGQTDDLSALSAAESGGATSPMAVLGPAPIPSATTAPASAAPLSPRAAPITPPTTGAAGGMAGMPMVPPGPLSAAAHNNPAHNPVPPDTKRVSAPAVSNGAPVQGRITAPLAPRTLEGRPVEARRIVAPPAPEEAGGPA